MDDLLITEVIESVSERLREEIADLETHLCRLTLTDYKTAPAIELQECLAQLTFSLDARVPGDARKLQRHIARAEASSPAVGAGNPGRTTSWVIQEEIPADIVDVEQETRFGQGLRYLSLPAMDDDTEIPTVGIADDETDNMVSTVPAKPPTRFGLELSRCTSTRQAVALVRKKLPGLRGTSAYEFLVAVGYPTAVPDSDSVRFCRNVGLIDVDDKAAAESYIAIARRAARVTGTPISHIGYLISLYAGSKTLNGNKAVCGKKPRCEVCALTARCSYYAGKTAAGAGAAAPVPFRRKPINKWAVDERPRERLLAGERLSNSELLAIILRTGSGRLSAVELARELINQFETLHDLEKASPQDIVERMKGKGIGMAKAAEICAAIEIGRRVCQPAADTRLGLRQIASSRDVFELCRPRYKAATQEEFLLLILNTKNRVQKEVSVSLGTLNSSIVHPRDVFRHALREAAAAVIFVHNHPSGDPAPSDEDILLTARLVDVGKLLGIQVLDHVIIGSHEWYSFADHGRLK